MRHCGWIPCAGATRGEIYGERKAVFSENKKARRWGGLEGEESEGFQVRARVQKQKRVSNDQCYYLWLTRLSV